MSSPPTTPPRIMRGATGSVAGAAGYAPAPGATDNDKALFGDAVYRAVTTTGTAASKAEADAGTNTTKYVAPDALSYALAAKRNALASAGALAFDGTASNAVTTADSTVMATGLDDFSHVIKVKRATYAPAAEVSLVEKAASNLGWRLRLTTGGFLKLQIGNGSNFTTFAYTSTVVVAAIAYKTALFAFTADRDGNVTFYENGVILGAAVSIAGSVAQTVTSTGTLRLGYDGTTSDAYEVFSHTHYNLALSQADITEIYELGGAVPFRFNWGTQIAHYASDFSAGVDGWWTGDSTVLTGNIDTNADGAGQPPSDNTLRSTQVTTTFSPRIVRISGMFNSIGKSILIKGTVMTPTGSGMNFVNAILATGTNGIPGVAITPGAASDFVLVGTLTTNGGNLELQPSTSATNYGSAGSGSGSAATNKSYWKNISIIRAGAVCHYDADLDGVGYQLHDQSTNKLHALLTTTGVSWTKAAPMGYVKVLSDGTTAAQQLGGGTILPANCQIVRIRARSISGTPSITLGSSSGGSQFVASVALSTTWQTLTIALSGGINTAANSLWMTASAANVVEVQLAYEQLPA